MKLCLVCNILDRQNMTTIRGEVYFTSISLREKRGHEIVSMILHRFIMFTDNLYEFHRNNITSTWYYSTGQIPMNCVKTPIC